MSENTKVESRRDFLKKMSKWSKIALGTAVGAASLGAAACYGDYCDYYDYCDGWGEDYWGSECGYCNYTNYPDYIDWA